jgi:hypothetical protein
MPRDTSRCGFLVSSAGGGDDVEADEREEHDRGARQHAVPAVVAALSAGHQREQRLFHSCATVAGLLGRDEGREVSGLDVEGPDDDHQQHHCHFDHRDGQADFRRQLGAPGQEDGDECDDQQRSPIELQPTEIGCAAAESEHRAEITRPAFGHHGGGDREFQDQVPTDDPRDELTERRVGEGVGTARHRHRRGELGVAQRGQAARNGGDDERD